MRVFGIDPGSTATGFAVVERVAGRVRLVDAGIIRTNPKQPVPQRLAVIHDGDPAMRIVDYCKAHEIDLVGIGRRGLGGLASLLLGSVSQKVSHAAPCACLLPPAE